MHFELELVEPLIQLALAEDIGTGDITTRSLVPDSLSCQAWLRAREACCVSGIPVAAAVFHRLDPRVEILDSVQDGVQVKAGATLLHLRGQASALLTAERTALNFLQRLSGIATLSSRFVEAVKGTSCQILDTRKTIPGWRYLEKYAVQCGGGTNHRMGLYDLVLIKDNHLAALKNVETDPIAVAVLRARIECPNIRVEVEADRMDQVISAVNAGADIVLLDNMSLDQLRQAVEICRGKALTEASGGIKLDTVREVALTGVDLISVGALTHSAVSVDLGLDFEL